MTLKLGNVPGRIATDWANYGGYEAKTELKFDNHLVVLNHAKHLWTYDGELRFALTGGSYHGDYGSLYLDVVQRILQRESNLRNVLPDATIHLGQGPVANQ